jgi:hypothetical protein
MPSLSYKMSEPVKVETDPGPFVRPPILENDINDIFAGVETRRYITKIIIHCSDSTWGDFKAIDEWHSKRTDKNGKKWAGITHCGKKIICGYHYIILNGKRTSKEPYVSADDGLIEKGRPDNYIGSHCQGQNLHSIGICLIGGKKPDEFTEKQFKALSTLLDKLVVLYKNDDIYGHYNFSPKDCPNFDVEEFVARWSGGYYGL